MPIFPRSVPTYVGRGAELARALAHIDDETLHLVYGVGGVGKSEFVFRVVEELRRRPRWADAAGLLVSVHPGMAAEHVLASLAATAGARRPRTQLASAGAMAPDDDLLAAARALELRPSLVFIDDLHHLDPVEAGRILGFLSRRVRGSRLLAASQVEIALPAGTPPPVIYRLGPLDRGDTEALVARLAERLDTPPPDPGAVFERTGGSPFQVLRDLAGDGGAEGSSLDHTLRQLDPGARTLLIALGVARTRISLDEAHALAGADAVRDLTRRFLVDSSRDQVMVHDLIRDAAVRSAARRELAAGHRVLAELYQGRGEARVDGADVVEVVHHLTRAGDLDDAWEAAQRGYGAVSAAGLHHLLLDDLRQLAGSLTSARREIGLLVVRILVRRGAIAEAADMLSTLPEGDGEAAVRWLLLAGEIAHRRGRLGEAEGHFRRAQAQATTRPQQMHAGFELADVSTLRGFTSGARTVLASITSEHALSSPREVGRLGWSLAMSYLVEERFAEAIAATRAAAEAIAGHHLDDLDALLAMLEMLARAECDDIVGARACVDRVLAKGPATGALREHALSFYSGVVDYHAGDLGTARAELTQAMSSLTVHADHVIGAIAGYYLIRLELAAGDVPAAIEVGARLARSASIAELGTLGPHGRVGYAEALLEAGRHDEARATVDAALASTRAGEQTVLAASIILARIAAFEGDLGLARVQLDTVSQPGSPTTNTLLLPAEVDLTFGRAARTAMLASERAFVELHGGDLVVAAQAAGVALDHYSQRGRRGMEARAAALRALALLARGDDGTELGNLIERAHQVATATSHPRVVALIQLARAARAVRRGDPIASALGGARPDLRHYEGRMVAAALGEQAPAPGVRALLSALGLVSGLRVRVASRAGVRVVGDSELERLRGAHRLVVEPARAVITVNVDGQIRVDRGRPLACELLAALVEAQGVVVPAETLFLGVWGGREYHPLRHRNTLYVAIKRLRTTLRELLGEEREIIETAAGGWRLADGIDAVSVRQLEGDGAWRGP
jgi:tetratricopeptide (TPR) repeat protein